MGFNKLKKGKKERKEKMRRGKKKLLPYFPLNKEITCEITRNNYTNLITSMRPCPWKTIYIFVALNLSLNKYHLST